MDAVITYVNGKDSVWLDEYAKHVINPIDEERFRDWGTLPCLIEGIRKFMPFVKKIFLVVAFESQVPKKINLDDITVVYHRNIIPAKYLPCFNSCAIEMFLHNIPGLSNEFIYFNDDTFVMRPMVETDFFVDGKPVLNPHVVLMSQFDTFKLFQKNCINSTDLIRTKFTPLFPSNTYIRQEHIMRPMLKSTYQKVWRLCEAEIYKSLTRTRHSRNYNAYLFNNYDYMTNNYVLKKLSFKYIRTGNTIESIISAITDREHDILCLNDNSSINYGYKRDIQNAFNSILRNNKFKFIPKEPSNLERSLKVALCAIAKNENLYIREWVEWYKNLGIAKIFLYDNNDIDGEKFEDVISDYIDDGFVEIINRRGVVKTVKTDKDGQSVQGLAYQDCFYNHYNEYDWMCFFDIDEFLEIYYKYKDLNHFLNCFEKFDSVSIQWKMYGDNNQLYYKNKPLYNRFKYEDNVSYDRHIKMILKCKKYNHKLLFCAHGAYRLNPVNVLGNRVETVYLDYEAYKDLPVYLNHFYSKSTDEFLQRKYNKPSAVTGINYKRNFNIDFLKKQYFEHNIKTQDKLQYFEMFSKFENTVNVYMASLYKDGHVIESIKSIIRQPEVKTLTLSANNYTDEQYNELVNSIQSDKLIIHRTHNERLSFEKLRYVNDDRSTKYVAFCDDDLIFYNGYFRKMIFECEKNDSVVSYHGGIFKRPLPINHYYQDRQTFTFSMEVKTNKVVDIIGNGVSLFKRNWLSEKEWTNLYKDSPLVSMDDILVSYTLKKKGKQLIVVKHNPGEVIERKNNTGTVYETYKQNDDFQTDWVNKHFVTL